MRGYLREDGFKMKSLDEDIGIERDGQLYLFKEYLFNYDWEVVLPRISHYMFNWMSYIGETES
jgi:hypothetical protein